LNLNNYATPLLQPTRNNIAVNHVLIQFESGVKLCTDKEGLNQNRKTLKDGK